MRHYLHQNHPDAMLISGVITKKWADRQNNYDDPDARYDQQFHRKLHTFNSLIAVDSSGVQFIRHKEKLVPFNERIPYGDHLFFLKNYIPMLDRFSFSLQEEEQRPVDDQHDFFRVGGLICYESLFGEFLSASVKNGANVIAIVLNEGWYDHPKGREWFLDFAVARAIESRRGIVRSSNCGYSSATSHLGQHITTTDQEGVITSAIPLCKFITFYTRFGDLIGVFCLFLLIIHFLSNKKLF